MKHWQFTTTSNLLWVAITLFSLYHFSLLNVDSIAGYWVSQTILEIDACRFFIISNQVTWCWHFDWLFFICICSSSVLEPNINGRVDEYYFCFGFPLSIFVVSYVFHHNFVPLTNYEWIHWISLGFLLFGWSVFSRKHFVSGNGHLKPVISSHIHSLSTTAYTSMSTNLARSNIFHILFFWWAREIIDPIRMEFLFLNRNAIRTIVYLILMLSFNLIRLIEYHILMKIRKEIN